MTTCLLALIFCVRCFHLARGNYFDADKLRGRIYFVSVSESFSSLFKEGVVAAPSIEVKQDEVGEQNRMRWKSGRQTEQDQEVKAHHICMVAEEEAKHVL